VIPSEGLLKWTHFSNPCRVKVQKYDESFTIRREYQSTWAFKWTTAFSKGRNLYRIVILPLLWSYCSGSECIFSRSIIKAKYISENILLRLSSKDRAAYSCIRKTFLRKWKHSLTKRRLQLFKNTASYYVSFKSNMKKRHLTA